MITLGPARALFDAGRLPFRACHASTLVRLPDDTLLAAFFAGEREGAPDTAIWLSRFDGTGWTGPERRFAETGLAHWNPVLHAAGDTLWLFYKVGPTVHDWATRLVRSDDGGRSWGTPITLVPGAPAPCGPVRNKLLVLADGAWLAGGSVEGVRDWDAYADRSEDGGGTWSRGWVGLDRADVADAPATEAWSGLAANALWENDPARVFAWDGVIQPTLWESTPGTVHMLLRSTRGRVYRSDSDDGGRSWCTAYATALPNNNSGLDLVRLPDGQLVLACNPVAGNWGRRSPLSLLRSTDNGATWSPPVHLREGEGEFSYPAIIASGARLDITFTADRRTIIHQRAGLA